MSLIAMLRDRYPAPEYAFFEELRNGTGFSRAVTRSADAVAFSLWPSRGLELHGFECKVSRGDWVRELKNPAKAEAIAQFCDRWWLVVGDRDFVHAGELPPTWGLLAPKQRGGTTKLVVVKEASKLEAKALDRPILAALFRNISEAQEATFAHRFEVEVEKRMNREDANDHERSRMRAAHEKLLENVRAFEEATGLSITFGYNGPPLGRLLRLLQDPGWHRGTLASIQAAAKSAIDAYRGGTQNAEYLHAEVTKMLEQVPKLEETEAA